LHFTVELALKLPEIGCLSLVPPLYYGLTDPEIAVQLGIAKRKVSYRRRQGMRTLGRTLGEFASLWI
jgi:FixJ family two-component response regulator